MKDAANCVASEKNSMKKTHPNKSRSGAAVGSSALLDARDEDMVARILIKLRLYAAFMELAGCTAKDMNADDIAKEAWEEIKREGIQDEKRAKAIMLAVSERI